MRRFCLDIRVFVLKSEAADLIDLTPAPVGDSMNIHEHTNILLVSFKCTILGRWAYEGKGTSCPKHTWEFSFVNCIYSLSWISF